MDHYFPCKKDLMEMVDYKNIYSQWLSTEGWVTQESYSMKDLESSQLAYYETEDIKDNTKEPESEALPKHTNMNVSCCMCLYANLENKRKNMQ